MEFGIISTKPGYDVKTTDPRGWNMNTRYPNLKVQSVNYLQTDGAGTPITITHNLGYKPLAMIWMEELASLRYIFAGDVVQGTPWLEYTDNTIVVNTGISSPVNLVVYIFYDPLE